MIKLGFLRRRTPPPSPTLSPPFDPTVRFAADHPFISGWSEHELATLLSNPPEEFAKLHAWVTRHPDTSWF
jgi:hypothetical protein